ncbi:polyketide synthase [Aspergillus luchuensis]|uniref:Polyketide synthase n=1 Tax=Aspergillus kawachii TaxID=1069201 RepID=A0A146FI61_ASPKA|nr:polyketide synthase [Aspergillus luchuensis]
MSTMTKTVRRKDSFGSTSGCIKGWNARMPPAFALVSTTLRTKGCIVPLAVCTLFKWEYTECPLGTEVHVYSVLVSGPFCTLT